MKDLKHEMKNIILCFQKSMCAKNCVYAYFLEISFCNLDSQNRLLPFDMMTVGIKMFWWKITFICKLCKII